MAITFDPSTKRIVLDSTYFEVKDIYSRWKEWVQTADNAKWPQAFRVVGGDPLDEGLYISMYCFLLNGWRIRPMETNHTLTLHGNIAVDGGGDPVVQTLGNFQVLTKYLVPERAQAYDSGGSSSSLTPEQIAAAVRSELSSELAKINELTFTVPNKVDANSGALYRFNGTDWVQV